MSSPHVVLYRFPTPPTEYAYAAVPPNVGETLKRGNDEWEVLAVETDPRGHTVVTLGPPCNGNTRPTI